MKKGLGVAMLAALMGCVGCVDTGYRGAVVVPEPDVVCCSAATTRAASMCMTMAVADMKVARWRTLKDEGEDDERLNSIGHKQA